MVILLMLMLLILLTALANCFVLCQHRVIPLCDPFNPSGKRKKSYVVAVEIATKLTEQHRLFSTKRSPNESEDYRFQPELFASSELRKAVTAKLNSLRGNSNWYRNVKDFQQNMTLAWRGEPEPAHILHGIISVWMRRRNQAPQHYSYNLWCKHG